MSWEDQGRQGHGWFGNGSSGGSLGGAARALDGSDVAALVAAGASASIGAGRRGAFEAYLHDGGLKELSAAIPVWAAASGMDAGAFRGLVVGAGVDARGAAGLQAVGRLVAGARDANDLRTASAGLGEVVERAGAEWAYALTYVHDQGAFASANGLLPEVSTVRQDGAAFYAGQAAVAGAVAVPGGGEGLAAGASVAGAALRSFGPWGIAAGILLGAGAAAYIYWQDRTGVSPGSGEASEARPPADGEQGDDERAKPPPSISPSAGTGTPSDPDEDPGGTSAADAGKRDADLARMERESGISRQEISDLAGFTRRLDDAASASTEASPEIVARLKTREVPREMLQAYKDFYEKVISDALKRGGSNASAIHRAAILGNILRSY